MLAAYARASLLRSPSDVRSGSMCERSATFNVQISFTFASIEERLCERVRGKTGEGRERTFPRSTCDVNFPVPKTRRSDFLRLSGALLASHKSSADLIRAIYRRNVLLNDVQVVGGLVEWKAEKA